MAAVAPCFFDARQRHIVPFQATNRYGTLYSVRLRLSSSSSSSSSDTSSLRQNGNAENLRASDISDQTSSTRTDLLHAQLRKLGVDPVQLGESALQSIQDPIQGYDGRYGKSAIRAYRSFISPKKESPASTSVDLKAMAFRTAQQIDFLKKRHESHETEWIRHHDANTTADPSKRQQQFPIILILDNVRSALNVGSLFRTADAAGCAQVWTVGITPHPNGNGADKLRKSALGAESVVTNQHFLTLQEAVDCIRNNGTWSSYQIVGMETTNKSLDYTTVNYDLSKGVALVLGNEVTGVTASVLSELDTIVEIPTFGVKNSLNVAACAPIVLYEIIRQWNAKT
eukprot:CAMPEP_0198141614 /NCGR_PEP_ID=MMETSP1443-20131203/4602_1 /TAXON_ID=186043 /ORGANISM="Entomoneis sp., Strain CCMP2396" /LENGTH=340 /DNA_ID=CAMNT_0043804417 /DNA_START=308 /DNA_END=1330 /DNA_ORIENTATION=-